MNPLMKISKRRLRRRIKPMTKGSQQPLKPPPPLLHIECSQCKRPIDDKWTCSCRGWHMFLIVTLLIGGCVIIGTIICGEFLRSIWEG